MENIQYKLPDSKENISFQVGTESFIPTATSDFLIKGCNKDIQKPGSLLDLGCGVGIVGITLGTLGKGNPIYASDLSTAAVELCKKNACEHELTVDARVGDGFEPWAGEKFDFVVDDISGIAESVAKVSPWFNNVPCNSGVDGTDLVVRVLKEAKDHLNENGVVFFPVISLSNASKIITAAKESFNNVARVSNNSWFLPPGLTNSMGLLTDLKEKGHIEYEERFGKVICYTDIYKAFD